MKVVVSGATGFVGRYIVEDMLAAGYAVTALGRHPPPPGWFSGPVAFVEAALDAGRDQRSAFDGVDWFVHAAFDHVPGRYRGGEGDDPSGFRRRNLDGSLALFEAARAAGVSRALFLSSRAALADAAGVPDTLYGEVKLAVENAMADMASPGFRASTLRLTGVYGPAAPGRPHKWADLFADYLAGRTILPRAGTELHGRDAAVAARLALEAGPPTALYEASDIMVDRRDLLAIIQGVTGCPHPLPARADSSGFRMLDSAALRGLGWSPGGWPLLEATIASLTRRGDKPA